MDNSTPAAQPNHILPSLLEGAQELLGLENMQQVLTQVLEPHSDSRAQFALDDSPLSYAGLPNALEKRYGPQGGHGLAQRIGRSAFKYLLQRNGDNLGLTSVDFRLQREPQRMKTGLNLLAGQMASDCNDRITVSDTDTHWVWRSERCPVCWGRQASDVSCYLTVGLIQEFFAWAGSGRFYRVIENECRASGAAACTFWIEKKPLD